MTYAQRLKNLQIYLENNDCDALVIENSLNISYLTGLQLSAGKLLAHSKGAQLIVDDRYYELCLKQSPFPVLREKESPFNQLLKQKDFSFIKKLAFDSDTTSYKSYLDLEKNLNKDHCSLVPLDNPVKELRMIKDEVEIDLLRQAAELGSKGFDYVCTLIQEGITELDIAAELEIFWKRHGSKSLAFDPIIAFGANSSMPHYRPSIVKLKKGDAVLIDIGVNYRNYHSDMTRVIFFGEPHPEMMKIYHIVRAAQQAAINICKPGILVSTLDAAARNYISENGYGDRFTHGLGHGVGLEIHELPVLKNITPYGQKILAKGMVITIEPGIYLPGIGGVRIEDTVVINEHGCENLTKRTTEPIFL